MVEPVHPFEGGELDRLEAAPGPAAADDLGLQEPDDGQGRARRRSCRPVEPAQGAMPASARRPGRIGWRGTDDPRSECATRPAPFAGRRWWIACSSAPATRPAVAVRLTRQPTIRPAWASMTKATWTKPDHVAARVEVAYPEPARRGRVEPAPHPVRRARRGRVLDRRLHGAAAHGAAQPYRSHQPLHRASGDRDALAAQRPPDLPGPVRARRSPRARALSRPKRWGRRAMRLHRAAARSSRRGGRPTSARGRDGCPWPGCGAPGGARWCRRRR